MVGTTWRGVMFVRTQIAPKDSRRARGTLKWVRQGHTVWLIFVFNKQLY